MEKQHKIGSKGDRGRRSSFIVKTHLYVDITRLTTKELIRQEKQPTFDFEVNHASVSSFNGRIQ